MSNEIYALLLDKTYSVREFSRILLKSTGIDFIAFYRDNVESGESVIGGVMGLCDIGDNQYLDIYKKYVYSAQTRLSVNCLLALNKFDRQLAIQYSFEMLGHRSGNVRKVAIGILAYESTRETLGSVRARYDHGDLRIKIAAMMVFKRVGGWSVLPDLMEFLIDENEEVRKLGWELLVKWRTDVTRLFVQPGMEDLQRARKSFEQVNLTYKSGASYLQEELLKQIAFFIR